jgi:hypothetical protein
VWFPQEELSRRGKCGQETQSSTSEGPSSNRDSWHWTTLATPTSILRTTTTLSCLTRTPISIATEQLTYPCIYIANRPPREPQPRDPIWERPLLRPHWGNFESLLID